MATTDMAAEVSVGIVVAASAAAASFIVATTTVLTFWINLSNRITLAESRAENALQEAAESKNDADNLREAMGELTRDHGDTLDRARREQGESLVAIRQHVTELAMFVRDNFVRNVEFTAAMKDIREGQRRLEEKLDRAFDHPRGHA